MAEQLSLADESPEYRAFVDKFKPKKTTDDCYTPPNVYESVLDWVVGEYGVDRSKVVRPFWPGGDFEAFDYSGGAVVVDNPPFSIVTKICSWYCDRGVGFFLFAPHLTNFSTGARCPDLCHVVVDSKITYENGAVVATSFVTNLDPACRVRSAPDLYRALTEADRENRKRDKVELPKYAYPHDVVMAAMVGRYSRLGIDYRVPRSECAFVRGLDAQRAAGKAMFGGGFLLSRKAAAERAAAERAAAERAVAERAVAERAAAELSRVTAWELSERERAVQAMLGGGE